MLSSVGGLTLPSGSNTKAVYCSVTESYNAIDVILFSAFKGSGKPIVKDIKDALYVFENSGLDVLWLEDHIIEKKN